MSAVYDELVLVVGHAAADRLVAAFAGTMLRVPRAAASAVAFVRFDAVVGADARAALVAHYGGDALYVPRNEQIATRRREGRALALAAAGLTTRQIAEQLAYVVRPTDRWVRAVLAKHRPQPGGMRDAGMAPGQR